MRFDQKGFSRYLFLVYFETSQTLPSPLSFGFSFSAVADQTFVVSGNDDYTHSTISNSSPTINLPKRIAWQIILIFTPPNSSWSSDKETFKFPHSTVNPSSKSYILIYK
jgi:hypothetical protein